MLEQIVDDSGFVHAALTWSGSQLVSARIHASVGAFIVISGGVEEHPLLGPSHRIVAHDGESTHMSAVDWHRPTAIPAIFSPGVLPAQTGTMLLNVIATLARDAGSTVLHYRGPYPTLALYQSLTQSFTASGPADEFVSDEWLNMALLGAPTKAAPNATEFAPDPFSRQWLAPNVCMQHRRRMERAMINDVTFHLESNSLRLVQTEHVAAAQVWFGDVCWTTIAEFDTSARPCALLRLHATPVLAEQVVHQTVGKQLPPALLDGLADLISAEVAPSLQSAVASLVSTATIRWAHTGVRAVRVSPDVIEIHAAIWQCVAPRGMAHVIAILVEILTPVFVMRLQRNLQKITRVPDPPAGP